MVGGMHGRGCAGWGTSMVGGGVHGRGHAWWGGACVERLHAWQGDLHGRGHVWQGMCIAGGVCGRGACVACVAGVCVAEGACVAGETVTTAAVRILLECILVIQLSAKSYQIVVFIPNSGAGVPCEILDPLLKLY